MLHAGIVDALLAVPRTRIRRGRATVAAGAFDEDAVTLAAEAALALLERTGTTPAALLLATVSAPLREGGAVQVVAELAGIAGVGLHVQEHGGTVSAGASALLGGAALVQSGLGPVLVVASDARRDAAGVPYGDGAVAMLLDTDGALGRLVHVSSAAEAFLDRWALGDGAVQSGDDSLLPFGPAADHRAALVGDEDVEQVTVAAPSFDRAGLLGCGATAASLLVRCDESRPTTLVVSAGGVTHALRFEPGPGLAAARAAALATLAAGADGERVASPAITGFDPYASGPRAWRERRQDLALQGVRCSECGEVLFPAPPACPTDGPKATLEPWRLGRRGTVLTCTRDHLFPLGAPVTMCVVDVDGGGRFYGQVTPGQGVGIGDRVRLVPRLLHRGGGRPQYFWKVQPEASGTPDAQGEGEPCR